MRHAVKVSYCPPGTPPRRVSAHGRTARSRRLANGPSGRQESPRRPPLRARDARAPHNGPRAVPGSQRRPTNDSRMRPPVPIPPTFASHAAGPALRIDAGMTNSHSVVLSNCCRRRPSTWICAARTGIRCWTSWSTRCRSLRETGGAPNAAAGVAGARALAQHRDRRRHRPAPRPQRPGRAGGYPAHRVRRHAQGIPYDAIDGVPARLFFLLLAPTVTQHLAILARLSRILRDPALRQSLLTANSPDEVIGLIREAEANM